jgi:trigger factor
MKTTITEEKKTKLTALFEVDDKELFSRMEQKALVQLSDRVSVKGYRPGKVPPEVLRKHIDERIVQERTLELIAEEMLGKFIAERSLNVISSHFHLKKYVPLQSAEFEIEMDIFSMPELPDYKVLAKEFGAKNIKEAAVSDQEVEDSIDYVRKSRATYATAEGGAKKGDLIDIDFEMSVAGQEVEDSKQKNYQCILGEERLMEGVGKELEGMKAGEKKQFTVKAPKDFWRADLKGKTIAFSVAMNSVFERTLPVLDDVFAKSVGVFGGIAELQKSVKEGLLEEKKSKMQEQFALDLLTHLADALKAEIPQSAIDEEVEKLFEELEHNLSDKGIAKEKYFTQIGKTEAVIKKEMTPHAERNIKTQLLLAEIAKRENIRPTDEAVKERVTEFLRQYRSTKDAEKAIDPERLYRYTEITLRNQQVVAFLTQTAQKNA